MANIDKIKALAKEKGITITFLCENVGMGRGYLKDAHRNKSSIPDERLEVFAHLLGTTVAYLKDETDIKEKTTFDKQKWIAENAIPLGNMKPIPVLGSIRAGLPVLAEENIEYYEFADVADPENYFYLKVKGDSMINANIPNGSVVLIKAQNTAENGDIVACLVNGDEATLKRFKRQGKSILLLPENDNYDPIIVSCDDFESGYACILGVAKEVKMKL